MSDGAIKPALWVFSKEARRDYQKGVMTFVRSEAIRARRASRTAIGLAGGMFALNLLLGFALLSALPLIRIIPFFIRQNADGTEFIANDVSSLKGNQLAIEAAIMDYVRRRESYSWGATAWDYQVVSAMSAPSVRKAYEDYMNDKHKSPSAVLRHSGAIRVAFRGIEVHGDTAWVHICRQVEDNDIPAGPATALNVPVEFTQELPVSVENVVRYGNVSHVVITRYPGAMEDAAATNCRIGY